MKPLINQGNNFTFLALSLVLLLFISALTSQYADIISSELISMSTVATLIICTYSIRTNAHVFIRSRVGLVVAVLIISTAEHFLELNELYYAHLLFLLFFYIWIAWLSARQVLLTGSVDRNKIVGAFCIYLLIGIIWAIIYMLVLQIEPDSFRGLQAKSNYSNFPAILYYSYVTLTTLGYGDIAPNLPVAQFFSYLQAITGQFYTAVVVASLIGARFSNNRFDI